MGSGVGGGSFFITVFILVLDLSIHYAIPLSKATILGVGIAAFCVNFFRRHPCTTHRTLIDYDLTVMFEPVTLSGTLVGVILNVLFPSWLVLAPLILLLSFTFYKTYKKGMAISAKERAAADKIKAEEDLDRQLINECGEQSNSGSSHDSSDGSPRKSGSDDSPQKSGSDMPEVMTMESIDLAEKYGFVYIYICVCVCVCVYVCVCESSSFSPSPFLSIFIYMLIYPI